MVAWAYHQKQLGSEVLDTSALLWRKRISKKTTEAVLEKMRRLVLRGATGAVRSTITAVLGALLGIRPPQKNVGVQLSRVHYRIKNSHEVKPVRESLPNELRYGGGMSLDRAPWTVLFDKNYKISLPSREERMGDQHKPVDQQRRHLLHKWIPKKGELIGTRVYSHRGGKGIIIPMGRYTTIKQAEMSGILAAPRFAIQKGSHRNVWMCTDSIAIFISLQSITA